jgi:hypothetical protein
MSEAHFCSSGWPKFETQRVSVKNTSIYLADFLAYEGTTDLRCISNNFQTSWQIVSKTVRTPIYTHYTIRILQIYLQ